MIIGSLKAAVSADLAITPEGYCLPFYLVSGNISAPGGVPLENRTIAVYKTDVNKSATATTDATGAFKVNACDMYYAYNVLVTLPGDYQIAALVGSIDNYGTTETIRLVSEEGYIDKDLTLVPNNMGPGPVINMTVFLEGLSAAYPVFKPTSLEVELRTGGATADTALPQNAVATAEVRMGSAGSGSNYGWWYNNISPPAGNYYFVVRQKLPGVQAKDIGANHIPIITSKTWEIVAPPTPTVIDLTVTGEAFTPAGRAMAMKYNGPLDKWFMRAGYYAVQKRVTVSDFNRWRDAILGNTADPLEQIVNDADRDGRITVSDFNAWRDTYLNLDLNRQHDPPYDDVYVP